MNKQIFTLVMYVYMLYPTEREEHVFLWVLKKIREHPDPQLLLGPVKGSPMRVAYRFLSKLVFIMTFIVTKHIICILYTSNIIILTFIQNELNLL